MHAWQWLPFASLLSVTALGTARAAAPKPNIIFIMADDLGFADVGYRGSPIKTPNIDKLAIEGIRLDSFYGEAVCTPSRAALMTGRYPMRYGLQTLVIFPSHTYGLPAGDSDPVSVIHSDRNRPAVPSNVGRGRACP